MVLSKQDQKRYEYLLKNRDYLNLSEQEELAQLETKKRDLDGNQVPSLLPDDFLESDQEEVRLTPRRRNKRNGGKTSTKTRTVSSSPSSPPRDQVVTIKKPRRGRANTLLKVIFSCLVLLILGMGAMFAKGFFMTKTTMPPVETEFFDGQSSQDGTNILILGSDRRPVAGASDARTDTIMVLNVGNSSGRPKLVSFMRDTLVEIAGVSTPGYTDSKLNSAFTIGEQNNNQGAELVRQTLKANFDLDIQYYLIIDFETFALAIDTLFPGGVQMDAQFSTVGGAIVDSVDVPDDLGFASGGSLYQTIAAGPQRMDGKTLLNYARFRGDDEGDYGRVRRQQEVLQAILSQLRNPLSLFTGSEALGTVYASTSTNLPLPILLKNSFSFIRGGLDRTTIPKQGDWVDAYDRYGGLGLDIDRLAYQQRLAELGLR